MSSLKLCAFTGNNSLFELFRLEEKGKQWKWNLWMKPCAFRDCDQTISDTHQAQLLWPHHRHLAGDTKYRHRGEWWKAVWVITQKCASKILWASVFVSIACVYFLRKFSSSLAEWSWPNFIDTLKATRKQHPSSYSPHTHISLYIAHTHAHVTPSQCNLFWIPCRPASVSSDAFQKFDLPNSLPLKLSTDLLQVKILSRYVAEKMVVCFDNHIKLM